VAGGELVDDADLDRGSGLVPLALRQHLHEAVGDAEHPGDPHDPAATGQQAERHLGQSVDHAGSVEPDPVMAGQPDLQAAAEGGAVHRCDHRAAERLEPAELLLDVHGVLHDGTGVGLCGLAHRVEVAAREERLLRRRDDHAGDVLLVGDERVDTRTHRRDVPLVHRVGAAAGVVEGDDDDPVLAALPADGL
jgi:hypothetical protein